MAFHDTVCSDRLLHDKFFLPIFAAANILLSENGDVKVFSTS